MSQDLPTRGRIRALPPGRGTDALVAQWALGAEPVWREGDWGTLRPGGWTALLPYSTDVAGAEDLLRIAAGRWPLAAYTFTLERRVAGWAVDIANTVEHGTAWISAISAPDAALAVCRALLFVCTLDPWDRNPPPD